MQLSAQPSSRSDYTDGSWSYTLTLTWASSTCDWAVDFAQAYDGPLAEGWTPLTDRDGDGYCVEVDDCRDIQARVHPGAWDRPHDGFDQDCDGVL